MLQVTLDGLARGSSYALLALGFTLVFGVLRRVNLAYGASIMAGIYVAIWIWQRYHISPVLLALVLLLTTIVVGAYVERLCIAPHALETQTAAAISMAASFAVWMQLEQLATLLLPRHSLTFPTPFDLTPVLSGDIVLRPEHITTLACTALVCAGLWGLLYRTRFGLAVRAMVDHRQAAACAGINVAWISVAIFALASTLGGVAGYLIVSIDGQITPMFAMWATLKGMVAALLGGLGSLPGAVVGALLLGVLEAYCQTWLGPQYRDVCGYVLLLAMLVLHPSGLSVWRKEGDRS